jgi:hypothetical protein
VGAAVGGVEGAFAEGKEVRGSGRACGFVRHVCARDCALSGANGGVTAVRGRGADQVRARECTLSGTNGSVTAVRSRGGPGARTRGEGRMCGVSHKVRRVRS